MNIEKIGRRLDVSSSANRDELLTLFLGRRGGVRSRNSSFFFFLGSEQYVVVVFRPRKIRQKLINKHVQSTIECIPAVLASMARSLPLIFILITLLDSGNYFILQKVKSDESPNVPAPPGTFLPGMKLGVNHRNGHVWSLSSSSGPLGSFTLSWDFKGRQLHISLGEVVYWSSGVFKDGRFEFISSPRYNFTVVSNKDEDSITYSTVDQTNRVSAWLLTDTGDLHDTYTGEDIARADNCDGYNIDRGCHRRLRPTSCMATFGYDFQLRNGYCEPIPSSSRTPDWFGTNGSYGVSECKATCWQDCDCLGFDFLSDNQTGCRFWSVDCQFLEDSGTASIYVMSRLTIPMAPSSPRSISKSLFSNNLLVRCSLLLAIYI